MNKVCLIALDETYGNIAGMAEAFSRYVETHLVLGRVSAKKMTVQYSGEIKRFNNIPDGCDMYFIVGDITTSQIKWDFSKPTTLIFTGQRFMKSKNHFNKLSLLAVDTYVMPNLIKFRDGFPTKIFYQPFDINMDVSKHDEILISHSPFKEKHMRYKGSRHIQETITSLGYKFDMITNTTWEDTMRRKAVSHIFIDQIHDHPNYYAMGVGKSGLEAMFLKCLVMSEAILEDCDIPAPPVVYTNKQRLRDDVVMCVEDADQRNKVVNAQYRWATTYLNYDFIAKRMLYGDSKKL
jgi:hypothetical protein